MPILSFNNIPYQVYRHYSMITKSNPLVSFSKQVEFNNSDVQISSMISPYPNFIHSSKARLYDIGRASQGKRWFPAYKGDSYSAVNIWPMSLFVI